MTFILLFVVLLVSCDGSVSFGISVWAGVAGGAASTGVAGRVEAVGVDSETGGFIVCTMMENSLKSPTRMSGEVRAYRCWNPFDDNASCVVGGSCNVSFIAPTCIVGVIVRKGVGFRDGDRDGVREGSWDAREGEVEGARDANREGARDVNREGARETNREGARETKRDRRV